VHQLNGLKLSCPWRLLMLHGCTEMQLMQCTAKGTALLHILGHPISSSGESTLHYSRLCSTSRTAWHARIDVDAMTAQSLHGVHAACMEIKFMLHILMWCVRLYTPCYAAYRGVLHLQLTLNICNSLHVTVSTTKLESSAAKAGRANYEQGMAHVGCNTIVNSYPQWDPRSMLPP
jgi:hypothetical protein